MLLTQPCGNVIDFVSDDLSYQASSRPGSIQPCKYSHGIVPQCCICCMVFSIT
jgi:hypothetical protein